MDSIGRLGLWLLAAGAAAIVLETAFALPRVLRLRRDLLELRGLAAAQLPWLMAWRSERAALSLEMEVRLRPFRRAVRILNHPLAGPLVRHLRRKRARG